MAGYFQCMIGLAQLRCLAAMCRERSARTGGVKITPYSQRTGRTGMEVKVSDLVEALKRALSLDARHRASLGEKLSASLKELPDEEAERLWAGERKDDWRITERVARERFEQKKFTRRPKTHSDGAHQVSRGSRG